MRPFDWPPWRARLRSTGRRGDRPGTSLILVDTNTWVFFLLGRPTRLGEFLRTQRVRTCDVVIGELCLGSGLPASFRADLLKLPRVPSPTAAETLGFIEQHDRTVRGAGVGWADLQVLVAAQRAGALLYTEDRALRDVWVALGYRLVDGGPWPDR